MFRNYYFGLLGAEQDVHIRSCVKKSPSGGKVYLVSGEPICRRGFKKLYSIGNNRLQKICSDLFSHSRFESGIREKSYTHLSLVQWLNQFLKVNVESLPNKGVFHLPDNLSKMQVFDEFQNEAFLRNEQGVTYSWFCRIWNQEFPKVKIPKRNRFSACSTCSEFKALRDKSTLLADKSKFFLF
jgi:hypothetical protein